MKSTFLILLLSVSVIGCTAGKKKKPTRVDVPAASAPENENSFTTGTSGKTLLEAKMGEEEKSFSANHEVVATPVHEGGYFAIHAEDRLYSITIHIPQNKGAGSFTCEAIVIEKNKNKAFRTDAAAVSLEQKNDKSLAGSFTILATDSDGNIFSVHDGRFIAGINKSY